MSKCPNCGVEVEVGAKFCLECGTAIPQTKECPKCHAEWPMNAKFCQECGHNFNGNASAGGTASSPFMGDKNVIAGDVNSSVSMSNSNNTTNNTNNNIVNNSTTTVDNSQVVTNNNNTTNNVTTNNQVTNNTTTNNTFIRQEIKEETELDKEAKRVQIEKLRLEKEHQARELERKRILEEAALASEKTRKAAELAQEKLKLKAIEEESNKSPYTMKTFRKLGLWGGFLGLQYAYIRRWPLFAASLLLMACMAIFGKATDPKEHKAEPQQVEESTTPKQQEKSDPITMAICIGMMALWFGGTFVINTDAQGRKLS